MLKSTRLFISAFTCILLMVGCGSSSDDNNGGTVPKEPPLDIILVPDHVDVLPSAEPVGITQEVDLGPVTPETGYKAISIKSMSTDNASPLLILQQSVEAADRSTDRYIGYNPVSGAFSTLVEEIDSLASSSISRDGAAVAWLDADSCNLWFQSLQPPTDPQRINDLLPEFSCPRPPRLSAHGEILLFNQAVGLYDTNGVLVYSGFDLDNYHTAIVTPASQTVLNLARNSVLLENAELDAMSRTLLYEASSHDGRRVAFRASFLPGPLPAQGLPEYVIGTLLVDTDNGEITLLNQNRYQRFYSQKVPASVQDHATVSGDGRIAWYVESKGITVEQNIAPSDLKRRDLESDHTITIDVPGFKDALWSSDDGNRLLFLLDGEVVVYRHDTGVLLRTTAALHFCEDSTDPNSCEFDGMRYVMNDPAMISGDGDTVLIRTIPERAGVDTPQNVMELMLLDVNTGTMQRVAPDRDILWVAMTPSASHIAYLDERAVDGTYLGVPRLLIINRQ